MPLFELDGVLVNKDLLEKVKKNNIYSVVTIKGSSAQNGYGDKGKNGVIQITTNDKAADQKMEKEDFFMRNIKIPKKHNGETAGWPLMSYKS